MALGDAPFAEPMVASLESALRSASAEYHGIVAHEGTTLVGLIVLGAVSGAQGAGRIYFVAVDAAARRRGLATTLLEAGCVELRRRRARFVVIELPEEPRLVAAFALARRAGFEEEARVGDYAREGVGLVVLRRTL